MRRIFKSFINFRKSQAVAIVRSPLTVESLGERIVPATGILRSSLGIVMIEGTSGDDSSQVSVTGKEVTVTLNSTSVNFPLARIKGLMFKGLNGNDSFANNSNLPSSAFGGNGNDQLSGGSAADMFFGGAGDDSLLGNGGQDGLQGDGGNDFIQGGSGNDIIRGSAGNDDLNGGSDNDILYGEDGDDRLTGDLGNDRVISGRGSDSSIRDSKDINDDSEKSEGIQQTDGLAKVEGAISAIDGSLVTIRTSRGVEVQLSIELSTVLEKNGVHVTLSDFAVGDQAEAKFDAVTRSAFKLESGNDSSGQNNGGNQTGVTKIEGTITAVGGDSVSIRLFNGSVVTVLVDSNTKMERNDLHVSLNAFQLGDRGEAKFNSSTMLASQVEAVG